MALSDVLRDSLRAFAQGTTFDQSQRGRQSKELLGGIQEASAQPGFNAATNPLIAQLQAVNPVEGQRVSNNFADLDEQRQKAMFQDAFSIRRKLDSDPAGALDIISDRVGSGRLVGGDMADTQEIGDLIAAGNIEQAKEELDAFLEFGFSSGGLKRPSTFVQSSEILPDGSTIQILKDGSRRVLNTAGDTVTGQQAADVIKAAQRFGVDIQGERALIREQKKQSQALSKDAFDNLGRIRTAVANLDDVISVIDAGAESGVIASRLPSVRAASIELDNLRNRMGLDVIGGTTFGALSESELNFALDTALPDTLEPAELRDWVVRKKAAQEKVVKALRDKAKFFSKGGSIAELLEKQDRLGETPTSAQEEIDAAVPQIEEGTIAEDEQGNEIILRNGVWQRV